MFSFVNSTPSATVFAIFCPFDQDLDTLHLGILADALHAGVLSKNVCLTCKRLEVQIPATTDLSR